MQDFDLTGGLRRRTLLRGALAAGAVAAVPGIAACGSDEGESTGGGGAASEGPTGTITFGSNYSDAVPKKALAEVLEGFERENPGVKVAVNTVDHNTFQEQINSYLQGRPDDVFAWFAGYRMQFFAQRGLATEISDVWRQIGADYTEAFKAASTGEDGEQYFVPFYSYPWGVFYRPSLFERNGYEVPTELDAFTALARQMEGDDLTPIAFADKDGWPAMGTFDILNMRINGYDFHINLMRGEGSWESREVAQVFDTWRELLPYHQRGALGRTWQDAAQGLVSRKAGMYLLGMFVGEQFPASAREDLDFFLFPEINPEHGQKAIDAPIDGFMLSAKAKNEGSAKALLRHLGGAAAQTTYLQSNPTVIAASSKADTSGYSKLQQKAAQVIGEAESIAQFLDRDTRPDFASTVMIPSLQEFIRNPGDAASILKKVEQQKKSIFAA
jgi:multiple sugar transport system substrate-binding protein